MDVKGFNAELRKTTMKLKGADKEAVNKFLEAGKDAERQSIAFEVKDADAAKGNYKGSENISFKCHCRELSALSEGENRPYLFSFRLMLFYGF